ncbi:hypothetical protein DFR49_4227 [Hephaestia caeni]|uniref:RAMA domain-containing protein n=1 Tax=Hephaestia caeni TaxID=645617 RepID=A0A397NDB6_9SPHN|nr:DUF2924 domain-containing protein [Hephaestia caeni]RIA35450.1 hypothetical protein DFR49_4227 [Hephaestia caeni]
MQIDIDFEVFKELTARREHEAHTYNDVLRELLGMDSSIDRLEGIGREDGLVSGGRKSFVLRDGELPDGTKLRAIYKGTGYRATIQDGRWVDSEGREHRSPSAAASAISHTNVNGLRFWHAKRPNDHDFTRLDILLARRP